MHQRDRLLKAKETRRIQKAEEQSDIFTMGSQKTSFQNWVASKNDFRSIWKVVNTLTNKDASKPQVTAKEIPPDKLNSHFAKRIWHRHYQR